MNEAGLNQTLEPSKRLSMKTIAKKVDTWKTIVIKKLSDRREGNGHIAGGYCETQILMQGKQVGHFNHNLTSKVLSGKSWPGEDHN